VLDSLNQYSSVVIINGLAAILFMIDYVLFGVTMIRTATLPRWSGVLVAVGAPSPVTRVRDSSTSLHWRVADRDLGQCKSRRRPGLAIGSGARVRFGSDASRSAETSMSTRSSRVSTAPGLA